MFVMAIMLLSMMKGTMLYAIYEYDKAVFIGLFCVNTDRPQLQCDGKCKLAEMQREKDERKADDMLKQIQIETTTFFPAKTMSLADQQMLTVDNQMLPAYYNHLYSCLFSPRLIKPPGNFIG